MRLTRSTPRDGDRVEPEDSVRGQKVCALRQTFLHLPRIGVRTEQRLWREGIQTWDDLEAARRTPPDLFGRLGNQLLEAIDASRRALDAGDADYFAERLPPREHYRIAAAFPDETVFLDIETTGLSLYYDSITLVGCARDRQYACHIMGTGDSRDNGAVDLIEGAKCLVTFNGTTFDLKFLAKYLPGFRLPKAHVDLRYLVRRAAMSGGQKEVEKALGLERSEDVQHVDGAQAVLLWYEYISGNVDAGHQLVRYNHADVEGMKPILDHAAARIADSIPFPDAHAFSTCFATNASRLRLDGSDDTIRVPRFPRSAEAAMTYNRLIADIPHDLTVVGIDLTGSSARPSGWCELKGSVANTCLIGSDDEILKAIANRRPHLVSIDSPLSLPFGRRHVSDDDPGRAEFGIMRVCERTLKRRGINVYPSLIPSMQRLTARGIRLAKLLRSRGVPVIESYPGAAQDIMNIPRKGAGIEHLKRGLMLFGVSGDYVGTKVKHDELDAITAAIVGLYFWANRFEALGNVEEDYLIVPDLQRTARSRRVIGVSGAIAAGKTTVARLLEVVGFRYGRYSEVLADLALERGGRADRHALQELGRSIHHEPGQRWLNTELLSRLREDGQDLVIDGLRWPEDHAFWVERFGAAFTHVHVSAHARLCRARYVGGCRSDDEFDLASRHEVESGVGEMKGLAHVIVHNNSNLADLRRHLAENVDASILEEKA